MVPTDNLLLFTLAAFGLVITPGPNMIYLLSRSITQGRRAGLLSLAGILTGFLVHICLVSFGLTAVFMTIPLAYFLLRWLGVIYLLYLAWQSIKPGGVSPFETRTLSTDSTPKLMRMGFLTSALNPKLAVFYLSLFPQFTRPEYGSMLIQNLELGLTQMLISATVNSLIVFSAARLAAWFQARPAYLSLQKWIMASILTGLAVRMAVEKSR